MSFWRKEVIQPALDRDVEAAITEQQAILKRDPNDSRAHFALGALLHFRGQTDAAIGCFLKAIELDPSSAAAHIGLGRIYIVRGQHDVAWRHAREAEQLGDRSLVEQLERYPDLKRSQEA